MVTRREEVEMGKKKEVKVTHKGLSRLGYHFLAQHKRGITVLTMKSAVVKLGGREDEERRERGKRRR